MNVPSDRDLKQLFESEYNVPARSDRLVSSIMQRKRRRNRNKKVVAGMAVLLAACFFTMSERLTARSDSHESAQWIAELESLFDDYDTYTNDLLNEPDGADELPAETYAYIQLMEEHTQE